jgi:hypothetical protein
MVHFQSFDVEGFSAASTQTAAIFVHFESFFRTEGYSLALLVKKVLPQFFDEGTEGLVGELHVVSVAEYLDTFITDHPRIVWIRGHVDVATIQVEMNGCYGELFITDYRDVVI